MTVALTNAQESTEENQLSSNATTTTPSDTPMAIANSTDDALTS